MKTLSVRSLTRARTFDRSSVSASLAVWFGLIAYVALAKLIIQIFLPNAFTDPAQANAFDVAPIAAVAGLGAVGVILSHRTGFPAALDPLVSNRSRFVMPAAVGVGFAAALIAFDLATG